MMLASFSKIWLSQTYRDEEKDRSWSENNVNGRYSKCRQRYNDSDQRRPKYDLQIDSDCNCCPVSWFAELEGHVIIFLLSQLKCSTIANSNAGLQPLECELE